MQRLLPVKWLLVAVVAAALAGTTRAGDDGAPDLETLVRKQGERIRQLESEVNQLRSRTNGQLSQDIEEYLMATEAEARDQTPSSLGGTPMYGRRVRIGGYFTIEFRDDGDGEPMVFDFHRLVPKIQAEIAEGISFETEIEIEGGGADVSFLSGNEILVEYAELSFELWDEKLDFVAGLILLPWGRFNLYHDDPLSDIADRPLVSRYIGTVAAQQPGIAVEGTLEIGTGWFLDYDIALVQGFIDGFTTASGARSARPSFRDDNNNNKQVFGRFVVTPPLQIVDTLELGTSFTYGKWDDGGDFADYGWALDLFVKRGPVRFIAEYMWLRVEQPVGAPATDPRRMSGWYAEIAYDFFPATWRGKHILLTDESTFTIVVRVEGLDLNHATSGTALRDDLQQVTIGFAFRPVRRTVVKISYAFVDSDLTGFESGSGDKFVIAWSSYF